jgi:deoxyhypusine synthase
MNCWLLTEIAVIKPIDLSKVSTYPILQRNNKVVMSKDRAGAVSAGMTVAGLIEAMPKQLGAEALIKVIDAVVKARAKGKPVIIAMGAHVIKCGLQPVLKSLIEAGAVTAFALNGAGSVHDYEISLIDETSEDVGAVLHCGTFGMAEETGRDINRALKEGVAEGLGYGQAIGRYILKKNNPYKEDSLIALCTEKDIPITVHSAIGTDIIHQHPEADGAVIGEATFTDFKIFTSLISQLGDGGVYLNIGSAVLLPEVFLKALSIAQNLGYHVDNFTTANFDMQQHYRPLQNVVKRPTAGDSYGYMITGHHEIMIPLLAAGILDRIKGI